jgi:quercetin dioxygenase-like cupin family protein
VSDVSDVAAPRLGSFLNATRFDPRAPVVATVTSDLATMVFVVCLEPAQELPRHPAPAELTLLVIEGEPVITVMDVVSSTVPGDVLVVAAGAVHALRAGHQRAVVVGVLNRRP